MYRRTLHEHNEAWLGARLGRFSGKWNSYTDFSDERVRNCRTFPLLNSHIPMLIVSAVSPGKYKDNTFKQTATNSISFPINHL